MTASIIVGILGAVLGAVGVTITIALIYIKRYK